MSRDDACVIFSREDDLLVADWEDFKGYIEDWDWGDEFCNMARYYEDYLEEARTT